MGRARQSSTVLRLDSVSILIPSDEAQRNVRAVRSGQIEFRGRRARAIAGVANRCTGGEGVWPRAFTTRLAQSEAGVLESEAELKQGLMPVLEKPFIADGSAFIVCGGQHRPEMSAAPNRSDRRAVRVALVSFG